MKYYTALAVLVVTCTFSGLYGELPEYYNSVDAVVWVVNDIDETVRGWKSLGFDDIQVVGEMAAGQGILYRNQTVFPRYEMALGRIGKTAVYWLRPQGGDDAISRFKEKHGSGVFSLMHRAPGFQALDEEVSRLKGLGVDVLQRAEFPTSTGKVVYIFMDTEPKGKYVLGLFAGDIEGSPLRIPPVDPDAAPITQYAFAVHDLDAVSEYWSGLGFPKMDVTHPQLRDLRYKDRPGDFDMKLGWWRYGEVPFEWTQSLKGPNVYLDHLEKHGEGIHHIAFNVPDMDAAVERWENLGFAYSMGGGWGEKGKPGSGRFVYVDAQAIGGTDVELLWNFKE